MATANAVDNLHGPAAIHLAERRLSRDQDPPPLLVGSSDDGHDQDDAHDSSDDRDTLDGMSTGASERGSERLRSSHGAPLSAGGSAPVRVELDGLGIKGYLSMRDEGVTYHRMKRFYCRCSGVNFARFASRDAALDPAHASFFAEVLKIEAWDGKGLLHTYRHSFKIYFTNGGVFNADADTEEDKRQWIEYMEVALKGASAAVTLWRTQLKLFPDIMVLSPGGLAFADNKKNSAPKFKNLNLCVHPQCIVRFESASKRQHHCRNCGGTICSDHSSRFTPLRHFQMNSGVRLCFGCYRVQRFVVTVSTMVQLLATTQATTPPACQSKEDSDEVEEVKALFQADGVYGISDLIQVLHLHRHGCDEAYALVVHKLLELAKTSLADFEFFLPQFFHLWLTTDWISNPVKAVLLLRVICHAAQLHVRFATALYWLARATIDDSCGWGFGQSELLVPDYLVRRFSFCKLLMINLEMQIHRTEWHFERDNDLPASDCQVTMLRCLFDRMQVLLYPSDRARRQASRLGPICDAVSRYTLPPFAMEQVDRHSLTPPISSVDLNHKRRVFTTQLDFIRELCEMTERLRMLPPDERKPALKKELEKLQLPPDAFCPLGSCEDVLLRFLKVAGNEGAVFRTRARAPTLIFFEVEQMTNLAGSSSWLQRTLSAQSDLLSSSEGSASVIGPGDAVVNTVSGTGSNTTTQPVKNAIEMATSSDIAHLTLNALQEGVEGRTSEDMRSTLGRQGYGMDDDDDQTNHSVISEEQESVLDDEEDVDMESRDKMPRAMALSRQTSGERRRGGSLIGNTQASLDNIIAVCADTLSGRRKRSISEGQFGDARNGGSRGARLTRSLSQVMANEVEKFSKEQLQSIAQNLEISALAENPTGHGMFTGMEVLAWMKQNEIVRDDSHAMWLGSELMSSGAIEPVAGSGVGSQADSDELVLQETVTYRIKRELSASASAAAGTKAKAMGASLSINVDTSATESPRLSPPKPPLSGASSRLLPTPATASRLISPRQRAEFNQSVLADTVSVTFNTITSPRGSNDLLPPASGSGNTTDSNVGNDEHNSVVSAHHPRSYLDRFQPDATVAAMESVERAIQEHVLTLPPDVMQNAEELQADLKLLKEQVELMYEFIVEKRRRRHIAVESAFGESFEEKRERLRKGSAQGSSISNWDCVALIVKSNDDLRQEVLCLQLIRQFQDIFQAADLPLRLLPYGIIATSASTGVIEYIKNATSLDGLKKRPGYTTLAAHFQKTYGGLDTTSYQTAMANYVRSMAAYSLVCYFLQIKDRHNGNIMIDSEGHVVHIDFGFILGIAPGGRFSMETAPFKLTAEMVEAMGGTQSEYFKAYVILLIQGFLALQQHADTILMMIAIMAQDSSCPCFLSQNPRYILSRTKGLFRLHLDQNEVIKYVLRLVRRSHNSYRTRQYDLFQKMSNGILP
ncbi:TPA: hypothetical protein N0F65_012050 [Lagenidium giganteum]|uniref:1-phosphatidylinositol 4-kinase n=1 Tax=Lagenidium giganteum TaxID=4803 RepID=A0AAV2YQJ0_9STRA|nr:TPA: hypothetical protein N0F65_012050 [Lagenidium giganteum]